MRIFQGLVLVALATIVYLLARLTAISSLGYVDQLLEAITVGALAVGIVGAMFVLSGLMRGEWWEIDMPLEPRRSRERTLHPGPNEGGRSREDGQVERGPE